MQGFSGFYIRPEATAKSKIRAGYFAEELLCSPPSLRSPCCAILAFLPEEPKAIRLAKRTATNAVSWSEALRLTCALKP